MTFNGPGLSQFDLGLAEGAPPLSGSVIPEPLHGYAGRLTSDEFSEAYEAIAFANARRLILNTHVSVTWSTVGIQSDVEVTAATDRLLSALKDAMSEARHPSAWICILENGPVRGLHIHLLLNAPQFIQGNLDHWLREKVQEISGREPLRMPGTSTIRVAANEPDWKIQWALFCYCMKNLAPDAVFSKGPHTGSIAKHLGIALKSQPPVFGVRLRVSSFLNSEARRQSGFFTLLDDGVPTAGKLFSDIYLYDGESFFAHARPVFVRS